MDLDIALLFSAQGGQWPGMGATLYEQNTVFRDALQQCDVVIDDFAGWSLVRELTRDSSHWRLHCDPQLIQPALTALQIAFDDVLRKAGVRPMATLGLSMGEVAAAYSAGALSRRDALQIVTTQARLTRRPLRPGRMVVACTCARSAAELLRSEIDVSVAVELAPNVIVLSGEAEAVTRCARRLAAAGVQVTDVPVGFAFHSGEVSPLQTEFVAALRTLAPGPTTVPFYSAACGGRTNGDALHAEHWWRIMSGGAHFVASVEAALAAGCRTFVEVGPHPNLHDAVRATAGSAGIGVTCLSVMARGEHSTALLASTLARLNAEKKPV